MDRINKIIFNQDYLFYLQKNEAEEESRTFCTHHFEHLLTVARLTYLLLLEEGFPFITREMAYAAGLLHDIGRWHQYRANTDHAEYSAELAKPILDEAGFSEAESRLILKAIERHRIPYCHDPHRVPLNRALKKADSLSRLCFRCNVREECKKLEAQPQKERLIY